MTNGGPLRLEIFSHKFIHLRMLSRLKFTSFVTIILIAMSMPLSALAQEATDESSELVDSVVQVTPIESAQTLLRAGRWEPAFDILKPLAYDPEAASLLFDVGMASLNAAHNPELGQKDRNEILDISIAAFLAILAADPERVRVRLELARAFFMKGEDGLSKQHFDRVMAGDIPPAVVANVQRFLNAIRARKRWTVYFGFALAPDTNIGQVSKQREIQLFGLPFQRDNEPPTSGVGLRIFTGGEYHYPINPRTRLRMGLDLSQRDYERRLYDRSALSLHIGPQFLISQRTSMSLLATTTRRWEAGRITSNDYGISLEGRHQTGPRTLLNFDLSWAERYYREADPQNNGHILDLILGGRFYATSNLFFSGSLLWGRERPDSMNSRNKTRGIFLGVSRDFARGYTVGLNGSLRRTKWDSRRQTEDGSLRKDKTTDISINFLKRDLTIFGFSPRLTIGRTKRDSNTAPHDQDYTRTYGDLSFVQQF